MSLTADPSKQEILTVPEVATYLRVTTKTVYALIKRGEIPSFKIGRVVRCRKSDVEQFIATASSKDRERAS